MFTLFRIANIFYYNSKVCSNQFLTSDENFIYCRSVHNTLRSLGSVNFYSFPDQTKKKWSIIFKRVEFTLILNFELLHTHLSQELNFWYIISIFFVDTLSRNVLNVNRIFFGKTIKYYFDLFPSNIPFLCPPKMSENHKMVKHTQAIRQLLPMNCLSMIDHFAVSWHFQEVQKIKILDWKYLKSKNSIFRNSELQHSSFIAQKTYE